MQNHPKSPENCGLTLREQIDRHTIILCLQCLDSRSKPPDMLPVSSKYTTRCFPSALCKQPWHIHPFCCYCARAQLLGGKRLGDTVCSAGWAVSASGRANKQLLKRTTVVSGAFQGRTRWLSDSSLWSLCLLCSSERNISGTARQRTLPRMDR